MESLRAARCTKSSTATTTDDRPTIASVGAEECTRETGGCSSAHSSRLRRQRYRVADGTSRATRNAPLRICYSAAMTASRPSPPGPHHWLPAQLSLTVLCLAALLTAGCIATKHKSVKTPKGTPGYLISCRGLESRCTERADELCPEGYDVFTTEETAQDIGNGPNDGPGQGWDDGLDATPYKTARTQLLIECLKN